MNSNWGTRATTRSRVLVTVLALVFGVVGTWSAPAASAADDMAQQILAIINQQRVSAVDDRGYAMPRKPLDRLDCTAQVAAKAIAGLGAAQTTPVGLDDAVAACAQNTVIAGNLGPSATTAADIVGQWMANTYAAGTRANILGAYTNIGIACVDQGTNGFLCEAIFSNAARPDSVAVTVFGDSYTSGAGVGDTWPGWRGKTGTNAYQSPQSQARVLARMLPDWTGLPVKMYGSDVVNDYSHIGSVTASPADMPFTGPWTLAAADYAYRTSVLANVKTMKQQIDQARADLADQGKTRLDQGIIVYGMGGNDIGFTTIALSCLAYPLVGSLCSNAIDTGRSLMGPLKQREETQLKQIIAQATPNSVLLVQGYPYLTNPGGSRVWFTMGYQPGGPLRDLIDTSETMFQQMVDDLRDYAAAYGVDIRFVPYAKATDGQAPYSLTGLNPNRGINATNEVGDEHRASGILQDGQEWLHPAAKLRHMEAQIMLSNLLETPMSGARDAIMGYGSDPGRFDTAAVAQPLLFVPQAAPGSVVRLPDAAVGTYYGGRVETNGQGPAPTITAPSTTILPGLTLYPDGIIYGAPQRGTENTDTTFCVTATRSYAGKSQSAQQCYSIHVGGGTAPKQTQALSVPSATTGQPYEFYLPVTGNPSPTFAVTSGTLPAGLTLDPDTGAIQGVPTTAVSSAVSITATNVIDGVTKKYVISFTLSVRQGLAPVITTPAGPLAAGEVGVLYSVTLTTNNPTTLPLMFVAVDSLPDGLTLDTTTGLISGTPTRPGDYTFRVMAYAMDQNRYIASVQMPYTISVSGDSKNPPPDPGNPFSWTGSSLTASPAPDPAKPSAWLVADGTAAYTLTLSARDVNGLPMPDLDLADIGFTTGSPAMSVTKLVNNHDGTYTAQCTSSEVVTAVVRATYQGKPVGENLMLYYRPVQVVYTPFEFSYAKSSISINPAVKTFLGIPLTWVRADGVSAYGITLTARDTSGALIPNLDPADLRFLTSSSSIRVSAVENSGDGTYKVYVRSQSWILNGNVWVTYKGEKVGDSFRVVFL